MKKTRFENMAKTFLNFFYESYNYYDYVLFALETLLFPL